jgi:hypothetical protein
MNLSIGTKRVRSARPDERGASTSLAVAAAGPARLLVDPTIAADFDPIAPRAGSPRWGFSWNREFLCEKCARNDAGPVGA